MVIRVAVAVALGIAVGTAVGVSVVTAGVGAVVGANDVGAADGATVTATNPREIRSLSSSALGDMVGDTDGGALPRTAYVGRVVGTWVGAWVGEWQRAPHPESSSIMNIRSWVQKGGRPQKMQSPVHTCFSMHNGKYSHFFLMTASQAGM